MSETKERCALAGMNLNHLLRNLKEVAEKEPEALPSWEDDKGTSLRMAAGTVGSCIEKPEIGDKALDINEASLEEDAEKVKKLISNLAMEISTGE